MVHGMVLWKNNAAVLYISLLISESGDVRWCVLISGLCLVILLSLGSVLILLVAAVQKVNMCSHIASERQPHV